ncbi:MAG: VCBS repeat-containing protein [Flavobacteriales bacterium]|nr:VCBS repeat-containing protein [Flavobacteriales bacterium]
MTRSLALAAFATSALLAAAQFGNPFTAFHTDTRRPFALLLEDLDADADLDVLIADQDSLYWFANDGSGNFTVHQGIDGFHDRTLATQDIDSDGDPDIVASGAAWPAPWQVGWYANDGAGNFTPMALVSPWIFEDGSPQWGDLDGDGDVDLVSLPDTTIRIRINNAGVFTDGPVLGSATWGEAISIAVDDADDDGDNDVLVFGTAVGRGYYENLGGGSFAAQVNIPAAADDQLAAVWDKDGDGDNDLLLYYNRWLINDGAAQYTAGDTVGTAERGIVADADADGDPDFFWSTTPFMNVWEGRNDGTTTTAIEIDHINEFNTVSSVPFDAGDINGDGHLDLLTCHVYGWVGWYAGDGASNWSLSHTVGSPLTLVQGAVVADFDLDGDLDMAAGGSIDDRLAWYPNDGTGTLGPQQVIADHMNRPDDLVVLDLELDGDSDLVLWNRMDTTVVRARNDGTGQFTVDTIAVQAGPLAVGYLDADAYPDLVAGDAWYANDGTGNFTLLADLGAVYMYDAAVGDMDGDQQEDIVYASYDMHVVKSIVGGAFTDLLSPSTGTPTDIALADLDLDGDLDVATISGGYTNYWYENDGTGALTEHAWVTVGFTMGPCDILAVDVNVDGAPDLVWAQGNNNGWIYLALNDGEGDFGPSQVINPDAAYALGYADLNGDLVPELWAANPESISWQQNFFYVPYRLRGSVFQDSDLDAVLDTAEPKLPFQLVRSDANELLIWTNSTGDYDLPADTGTWNVWTQHAAMYEVTNDPDTLTTMLTIQDPVSEGLDLGFAPAGPDTSAVLSLTSSLGMQTCNAHITVWVHLMNTGTYIPHDVVIDVLFHPDLMVASLCGTSPDSIVGGHYYWHVDSLNWFQQWSTCVTVTSGPIGSNSTITATAIYVEAPPVIYTESIGGIIACAFDPNDKLVTPVGYGSAGAVPIDLDHLDYTIRFQNTGTDTALNVVLVDALDPSLRWESMQVLAASHPLTSISVDESGVATFRFNHILLPDSNVNEPASHGFIKYSIEPVTGAPHGTEITNTAAIYFDLNAPVITNTTLNTLVDCDLFSATIILGGVDSLVASDGEAWQWFLNGDSLPGANERSLIITVPGDYAVQITSNYGCVALSDPFQVISTSVPEANDVHIALWPDPAHDRLFVHVPGPAMQAWVLDATGRVCRNALLDSGTNTLLLNGLGTGAYTLRCSSGEVLRFIKQ